MRGTDDARRADIRPATAADGAALATLYNAYIRDSLATFEEEEINAGDMQRRLEQVAGYGLPWLIASVDGQLAGYAYATRWRERSAYRFTVESSVYLAPECHGAGLGTALYTTLLEQLRGLDLHAVIGGITLPNPASVALHEKLGFEPVARFPQVGYKFGRWLDVGYWQLTLVTDA